MRSLLCGVTLCIGAGVLCQSHAQECKVTYAHEVHCASGSCQQVVAVNDTEYSTEGFYPFKPFYVSCCNLQIETWSDGPVCEGELAKGPAVDALAAEQPILVADCMGRYVEYGGQTVYPRRTEWSPRCKPLPL